MFVGHLGAGLAVKAAEPRWNLGVLFAAALFARCAASPGRSSVLEGMQAQ